MMSRAAYMMQDHVRRSYAHITDIREPSTFLCRGRLPFPQGLAAVAVWFHRKTPADLYAHRYFTEKQSNPDQPSPQMHTTEEVQGIMKVMQGLRYMRDDFSKLDNTMLVVTDYLVPAKARMLGIGAAKQARTRNRTLAAEGQEASGAKAFGEGRHRYSNFFPHQRPAFDTMDSIHQASSEPFRARFPATMEAVSNPAATQAFFKHVLQAYIKDNTNASSVPQFHAEPNAGKEGQPEECAARYNEYEGGYTVLYNPCELNDRTFAELIARLVCEERVVKAIVVPTRQAWGGLQVWADAFPDATILSSGPIPTASAEGGTDQEPALQQCGSRGLKPATGRGYREFGGGVTGISFPEVDLEPEERQDETQKKGASTTHGGSQPAESTPHTRQANTGVAQCPGSSDDVEDIADILWSSKASHIFATHNSGASMTPQCGLRLSDAHRVRDLSKEGMPPSLKLTSSIDLLHVPGDAVTDEYVLYDHNSKHIALTDLFHGEYSDYDALNTWLCRVWFKFMKQGNHKRTDLVPRFKWRQVCQQGTLQVLQDWVDRLTRLREIRGLVYAHGTPPLVEDPVNRLREQWNLPPLTTQQLRQAAGRSAPHAAATSAFTKGLHEKAACNEAFRG